MQRLELLANYNMLRRIATSIETTVAKYKTNEDDPELLDTEEQKELIDNLRIDNEKSTRFHRVVIDHENIFC